MIIGVDPGTEKSAAVALEDDGSLSLHMEGVNAEVKDWLATVASDWQDPVLIGIEDVRSYGMPIGRSTIETIWWSGRFYEAIEHAELVVRIPRKDIVVGLCGNARAGDRGVRDALLDLYPGGVGTKASPGPLHGISGHKWAALAVAVHLLNMVKANDQGEPN